MHRLLAATTAALAALAIPAAATAAPAADLQVTLSPLTIAPHTDGGYAGVSGFFRIKHAGPVTITYTVDFSAISGFARIDEVSVPQWVDVISINGDAVNGEQPVRHSDGPPQPCQTTGTVITCTQANLLPTLGQFVPMADFRVFPTAAAKPGDEGVIHVRTRVDDGPAIITEATVKVGEPVNLAGVSHEHLTAAPGATVRARPQVRNTGKRAVQGAVLILPIAARLVTSKFSNCVTSTALVCTFDTTLQPGRTYRVSQSLTLRTPSDSASGSQVGDYGRWMTMSTFRDGPREVYETSQSTGPLLRLEPMPGAAAAPQLDVHPGDDDIDLRLKLTGTRRADLTPIGESLTAAVGDTVQVKLGYRNRGPATLRPALFGNNIARTQITMPPNLKVIRADHRCSLVLGRVYYCGSPTTPVPAGNSVLFTFTAKVRKAKAADGKVFVSTDLTGDRSAKIVVSKPGGGATVAGLPITGPSVTFGLVLILAGALLITLSKLRTKLSLST